jgi:hypothetical protein
LALGRLADPVPGIALTTLPVNVMKATPDHCGASGSLNANQFNAFASRKLAIICRFLISISSGVNLSRSSAQRIHLCSSSHVSYTAAEVIAPSPNCLGRINRRGVRIGIGRSINTGLAVPITHHVSEELRLHSFNRRAPTWPHARAPNQYPSFRQDRRLTGCQKSGSIWWESPRGVRAPVRAYPFTLCSAWASR